MPTIETFSSEKPTEHIGDLYGYRRGSTIYLTHAFTYITPRRNINEVDTLDRTSHNRIQKNLETLLATDPKIQRAGDFHSHPLTRENDYTSNNPNKFFKYLQYHAEYSDSDLMTMRTNTHDIYLIIAFGPKRVFTQRGKRILPTFSHDLYVETKHFLCLISGWYYNPKEKKFVMARVKK